MASGSNSADHSGQAGWAYGNANTVKPAVTTGFFFEITADAGEQIGNQVRVGLNWVTEMMATGTDSIATIDSGYAANRDIAVTLNDYPATQTYDLNKVVWSYAFKEISGLGGFSDSVQDYFIASIGDIIGIHMGTSGSIVISGDYESPSYVEATANQEITLTMETLTPQVPVPGTFLLLAGGLIGLTAFRRKR